MRVFAPAETLELQYPVMDFLGRCYRQFPEFCRVDRQFQLGDLRFRPEEDCIFVGTKMCENVLGFTVTEDGGFTVPGYHFMSVEKPCIFSNEKNAPMAVFPIRYLLDAKRLYTSLAEFDLPTCFEILDGIRAAAATRTVSMAFTDVISVNIPGTLDAAGFPYVLSNGEIQLL